MGFEDDDRPRPAGGRDGWAGSLAVWAGACGAAPFGLGLWWPLIWIAGHDHSDDRGRALGLLSLSSLVPFAIALARVGPGDRRRVAVAAAGGLAVGFATVLLSCLALLVHLVFVVVGLVAGLAAVVPCWWRGDAAGRSLALLGPAPVLAAVIDLAASHLLRAIQPGQVAPLIPFLTVDQALLAVAVAIPAACVATLGPAILRGPVARQAKPGGRDPLD